MACLIAFVSQRTYVDSPSGLPGSSRSYVAAVLLHYTGLKWVRPSGKMLRERVMIHVCRTYSEYQVLLQVLEGLLLVCRVQSWLMSKSYAYHDVARAQGYRACMQNIYCTKQATACNTRQSTSMMVHTEYSSLLCLATKHQHQYTTYYLHIIAEKFT